MYSHSFRSNVVTGSFTLPVMAILTLVVWMIPDVEDWRLWAGLGMTFLTAYSVMELNNRHTLLRVRSRMMSVSYLTLMLTCPALHAWHIGMVPPLFYVVSYLLLFASYQKTRAEGYIFHAFLFCGIGSLVFPPMLVLLAAFYFSMIFQLRNFTWRTFMAGLFGLAVPYWFYAANAVWHNHLDTAFLYLIDWFHPALPDYSQLTLPQLTTAAFLIFIVVVSLVHFFHTAYNDKIRTRMLFYVLVTQEICLLVGMVMLPSHFETQSRLFAVNSAAFIAHYYAFGRGRFFDLWFNLSVLLFVGLGVFNYLCLYGPLNYLQTLRPLLGVTLW